MTPQRITNSQIRIAAERQLTHGCAATASYHALRATGSRQKAERAADSTPAARWWALETEKHAATAHSHAATAAQLALQASATSNQGELYLLRKAADRAAWEAGQAADEAAEAAEMATLTDELD